MEKDRTPYQLLLVEDNPGDRLLLEDQLRDTLPAARISFAGSFAELSQALAERPESFDILFLDLSLPDKSGEELIRDTVDMAGDIPVVVLTGRADIAFSVESIAMGVSDYLLKEELDSWMIYKSLLYNLERKKSVKALAESRKRYSELFHLSPQPMWVTGVESGAILDVNSAAREHFGYSREALLTMRLVDIFHPDEREDLINALASARNGEAVVGTFCQFTSQGEERQVELRCSQLQFSGHQVYLILANDLTERMAHMRAIEDQNERLRDIAWTQSHVVRAPLARILGLVHLLQDLPPEDPEFENGLEFLLESAHELDAVVRSITQRSFLEEEHESRKGSGL